ncbi:hypothetical protein [Leifsonia sp. NPDC080035]|uniref:Excisionase n=1 Tax=Leifsonia sp. NPDC080035 TaxID=3143936 RepID=A0AAU7GEY5_9MICO
MGSTERVYSLAQAATVTGFSLGKFRYNKAALIEAGAKVDAEGWRIPHSTLRQLGWIGVKPPKGAVPEPSALERAELRIAELEAELASLREQQSKRSVFGFKRK